MTATTPADVLERLCRGADRRRAASLRTVHAVCEQLVADGAPNFSIKAIGRLSQRKNGPGERALLNPAGAPYRQLIEAHREHAGIRPQRREKASKGDIEGLLEGIKDPAQRARIELLRSEVAALRRQVQLLQKLANDSAVVTVEASAGDLSIPPARAGEHARVELLSVERDALRDALDLKRLAAAGLDVSASGRILAENGSIAFPVGFATALQKLAKEFGAPALPEFVGAADARPHGR